MRKVEVKLTDAHAAVLDEAVASGDYASADEVIREALRDWRTRRTLRQLWDEGLASGRADPNESMDDLKAAARRERVIPPM